MQTKTTLFSLKQDRFQILSKMKLQIPALLQCQAVVNQACSALNDIGQTDQSLETASAILEVQYKVAIATFQQEINSREIAQEQLTQKVTSVNNLSDRFSEMKQVVEEMLSLTEKFKLAQEKLRANWLTRRLVDVALGLFNRPTLQHFALVGWLKGFKEDQDVLVKQANDLTDIQSHLKKIKELKDPLAVKNIDTMNEGATFFNEKINSFGDMFLGRANALSEDQLIQSLREMTVWTMKTKNLIEHISGVREQHKNYHTLEDGVEMAELGQIGEEVRVNTVREKLLAESDKVDKELQCLIQAEQDFTKLVRSKPYKDKLKGYANRSTTQKVSALIWVLNEPVSEQQERFLKDLVHQYPDCINQKDERYGEIGQVPLHVAVNQGHLNIVKCLVNMGARINPKDNNGKTPLLLAFAKPAQDIVAYLTSQGATVETDQLNDLFINAVHEGKEDVVALLLREKRDELNLNVKNEALLGGDMPLSVAVKAKNFPLAKVLFTNGAELASQKIKNDLLYLAADAKDELLVKTLLKMKAEFWVQNKETGNHVLHLAAQHGQITLVKNLAKEINSWNSEEVAVLNAQNGAGDTALHLAVQGDFNLVAEQLLAIKGIFFHRNGYVDVNIKNGSGKTALAVALERHNAELAKLLVEEKGAHIAPELREAYDSLVSQSQPAVNQRAPEKNQIKVRYDLLRAEAKNNIHHFVTDQEGETLLHLAAATGRIHFVNEALIKITLKEKKRLMLEHQNNAGNTPVDIAIKQGNFAVAKVLVQSGAEVNANIDKSGSFVKLPLIFQRYLAAENLELEEEYLNLKDKQKEDLSAAVEKGNVEYVKNLFEELNKKMVGLPKDDVKEQQLIMRRIFELISLQVGKPKSERILALLQEWVEVSPGVYRLNHLEDQTLLDQLAKWAIAKQNAILCGEQETDQQKKQSRNYANIARILIQYVPEELLPRVGLEFYDLLADSSPDKESEDTVAQFKMGELWDKTIGSLVESLKPTSTTLSNIIEVYKRSKDSLSGCSAEFNQLDRETRENQQGQNAVLKMNEWCKSNRGRDINVRDGQGNTLLHLAVQDNMGAVVGWLIPEGWQNKLTQFWQNFANNLNAKMDNLIAEKVGNFGGEIIGDLVEKGTGVVAGVAITAATLPILGPFAPIAGLATGKLAGVVAGKITEVVSGKILCAKEEIEIIKPDGVDFNLQNDDGDTPLHIAARNNHKLWMVVMLLPLIKNINMQNNAGETPLHIAIRSGSKHIVAALMNAGVKLNIKNALGETPLHLAIKKAVQYEDFVLFRLLIEHGADINVQTKLKRTALDLLNTKYNLLIEKLKFACEKDTDEELKQSLGKQKNICFLMKDYLEQHINKNPQVTITKTGVSPEEVALQSRWYTAAAMTKAHHDKPITQDELGNTLLHVAVQCGDIQFVTQVLAEKKIDINQCNKAGETLLHIAARAKHSEMIGLLLQQDANINSANKDGKRPWEVCRSKETLNVFNEYLRRKVSQQDSPKITLKQVKLPEVLNQSMNFPSPLDQKELPQEPTHQTLLSSVKVLN